MPTPAPTARVIAGAALATAVALAGCSGSSAKSKAATTTAAAAGTGGPGSLGASVPGSATTGASSKSATTNATTAKAAPGKAGSTPSGTATPPAACALLTTATVFALVGTVRDSTATLNGATSSCAYTGQSGHATLSVTEMTDGATAHAQFVQAEKSAGNTVRTAFGVGDEAYTYPGGIKVRVGQAILTISGSPAPNTGALETAAASAVKAL